MFFNCWTKGDIPEVRLWRAVLHRAVQDALYSNVKDSLSAWHWIYAEKDNSFNSFEGVCSFTNCSSYKVRRLLAREFVEQNTFDASLPWRKRRNDTITRQYGKFFKKYLER